MGLMDKFKNLFTDEEIIEEDDADAIEIKEVKKEEVNKLPTFMREKIEKEEKNVVSNLDVEKENKDVKSDKKVNDVEFDLPKIEEKSTFKFPIDFGESDFVETRSRQSIHQRRETVNKDKEVESVKTEKKVKLEQPKVANLYKDKKPIKEEKKAKFKATPIISPIYGILDKNYTSTDIAKTTGDNLENSRHSKSIDFDSVRKKAYGSLTEEIKENLMCENCEYLKEAKECQKEKEQIPDVSYEVLDDEGQDDVSYQDITLDEATENYYDYGVEYEKQPEKVEVSHFEERPKKEIPPVKSSINLLSTLKKSMGEDVDKTVENAETSKESKENLELTDDLFNLIDSMYDERNGNKW